MPVPVMDPQPSGDSGRPVEPSSAIVIADSAEMRSRIAAALAAHDGLQPAAQIDDPAAIAGLDTDASTIIIFACKADAGRDIARLRRLRGESRDPAIVVISPSDHRDGVRRALDAGADALVFESELELHTRSHDQRCRQRPVGRPARASCGRRASDPLAS